MRPCSPARAGEQGRGFAVVASEVRALALRSADAAGQIKGLINDSVTVVEEGMQLVDQSGSTLTEILGSAQSLDKTIIRINELSAKQSTAIEAVANAVRVMAHSSAENASMVDNTAAASTRLAQQAASTQRLVNTFRI